MTPVNDYTRQTLSLERSGGTLERRKGIYIVHLHGTYAEMGRQHAELASAVCGDVVPRYMDQLLNKLIALTLPSAAGPVAAFLRRWFHLRNRAGINDEMRAHLAALAKAYGLKPVDAERLFLMPDIFHYLAGHSFMSVMPPPACSGFFACGSATQDGKVILGRNFDFFGRGVWNTNNAIIIMHPPDGRRICWVGALGVTAGGQAFNDRGMFIGLHTKFTRDLSMTGLPVYSIVHDILANSGCLEEALNSVSSTRRICGLTLFIADTRARTAAAAGFSARKMEVVRPLDNVLVHTNHYITKEMKQVEVAPYPWQANSYARFERLAVLLEERRGRLKPEDAPLLLSDCIDPFEDRKRVTGHIVAGANNVQSLVLSPDDDALWLANADYPVCHSDRFHGFRISALLDGDTDRYEINDLPGAHQLTETERAAVLEYEEAWTGYFDYMDSGHAVFHLLRAAELLPDEPIFPRMAGLLLLKQKRYKRALPLLQRNADFPHRSPLTRAEAHLWLGRCLDLLNRRAEAIAQYECAAGIDAHPVSAGAKRHLEKPYRSRDVHGILLEFIVGTAISKY